MTDKHEGEAGATGSHKTGPRFSWLTGQFVAQQLITLGAAAVVALIVANTEYRQMKADIKTSNKTANEAHGIAIASQTSFRHFRQEFRKQQAQQVLNIKTSFGMRFAKLSKDMDARFDKLDTFTVRMDEATKWMQRQHIDGMQRMREEWRDYQQRRKQ